MSNVHHIPFEVSKALRYYVYALREPQTHRAFYIGKGTGASGIVNDPNDWAEEQGDRRYILDLLARTDTVSIETVKIVKLLPALEILDA